MIRMLRQHPCVFGHAIACSTFLCSPDSYRRYRSCKLGNASIFCKQLRSNVHCFEHGSSHPVRTATARWYSIRTFKMPDILGMYVNSAACIYMVLAFGIYCLPASLPTAAKTMNYAPVIWTGCSAVIALFWTWFAGERYSGPRLPIT